MIKVLHVDDDVKYAESLKTFMFNRGIEVFHAKDFEEMKDMLEYVKNIVVMVILDIKGKFNENDEFDDESFLASAMSYLDSNYKTIPRAILTGDTEGFKFVSKFMKSEKVFRKGNDSELKMIEYIEYINKDLDSYKIEKEYSEIFEIFEKKLLPVERREELINIIKCIESAEFVKIQDNIGRIRDIQEEIMFQINKRKPALLPDDKALNSRDEISFTNCNRYLEIQNVYPDFVSLSSLSTYKIGCRFGVHTSNVSSGHLPTKYTAMQSLFSLLDLMQWYKRIVS